MSENRFSVNSPCDECPWRRDAMPGRFPPHRYRTLAASVEQGFAPMFACHKTERKERACAGYLLSEDSRNNFRVRIALARGMVELSRIRSDVPMFATYAEMALANGYDIAADRETGAQEGKTPIAVT